MTLKEKLARMRALQDAYKGKAMPEAEAKEFTDLATEVKVEQDALDRDASLKAMEDKETKRAQVPGAAQPGDGQPGQETPEQKAAKEAERRIKVVGYLRLGAYVTAQKALADFRAGNMPRAQVTLARVPSLHEPFVGLTAPVLEEMKQTVPTIGAGVIEPTRLPEVVRVTEHDRLVLRDVLDIGQTSSDAVKYTRIVSYTRGALAVAPGSQKPHSELVMDAVTEPVRTIAVWMPVQDQQLEDLPQLQGIINGELLYDVNKHVEELVAYGSGAGEEFSGLLIDPDVQACRNVAGDTLVDIIRRGITDVRRAGYEPNGVLVDPLDWETIVLLKGSDQRYVWVVVTDGATQRLWGVPVIETVAMTDFQGVATEERNLLVGDFARGCTLWDRMQAAVSVGWINDQFVRNQRTLLAELRAAFGIKRPGAFRKYRTQEASAS